MRILFRMVVVIGVLLTPLFAANSQAATESEIQIKALKEQLEQIQRQNQQQIEELKKKIEELEAERAAEQKQMEEQVTKEKEGWWNKIEVSYKKPGDGFTLKTKDENFLLNFRIRTQFQFSVNDTDDKDTATDFNIRRFRLYWIGNAFRPWFLYYTQLSADNNGELQLRDAFFDVAYDTMIAPRGGQYKVPFNREELNSSSELQLVERSIVNDEFAFGRDRGAGIYGALGNYIVYGAGVFNGDGRNGTSVDSNLLYAGRVQFTPCCGELKYKQGSFPTGGDYNMEPNFGPKGKVLIAISAAVAGIPGLNIDRKTPDNDIDVRFEEIFGPDAANPQADVIEFTADVNFRYYIFSLEGEYVLRHIDPEEGGFASPTDQGFRIQSGIFLVPELIEVAGRFALIDFDTDVPGRDKSWEITPGLNFYMSRSHKWKLQFSYSFIRDEDTDETEVDQNIFRAQLQAYF